MKCLGKSHERRFPYQSYQCSFKAWKDGYCKIHHPELKTQKNKERIEKKESLYKQREVSSFFPFHIDDPNSIRIIEADYLPERTMILSSDLYKKWMEGK